MADYNILFITSDQHKKAVTGCYGDKVVQTPNIDKLAVSGVRFTRAYCASPLCGPSRAAIMTGANCHTCGMFTHQQDEPLRGLPTLGSVFKDAGYATASIGKVHIQGENEKRDFGFKERALRCYTYEWRDYIEVVGEESVDEYASYREGCKLSRKDAYNPKNVPVGLDDNLMYDALVVERAVKFMKDNKDNKFFAWVGLEKPHPEWYAPEKYHKMYNSNDMILPETIRDPNSKLPDSISREIYGRPVDHLTEEQIRGCMAAYYANVSYMDMHVGKLIDALETLKIQDRTIVIYTADHGENLFEHGLLQKHCFYEPSVAVPLVISMPKILPENFSCDSLTSLIDLFPTCLDLAGISQPETLEGVSLLNMIMGNNRQEGRAVFSEFYSRGRPERMILTDNWKYIYSYDDIPQLYDVKNDLLERHNLIDDPKYEKICAELKARVLDDWEFPPSDIKMRDSVDKLGLRKSW